jgi:GTP pyrophosphokinase
MKSEELFQKIEDLKIEVDKDFLNRAIEFANISYGEAKRLSGEDEVGYLISVASSLLSFGVYDAFTLSGAILHEVLEETAARRDDLEKEFGKEFTDFVVTIGQLSTIKLYDASQDKYVENLRRMFLSAAHDIRVVLVKLADRLENLKTLNFLSPAKQERISRETLEIFAPLAYRLGMGEMKGQLEDLAFPYVYPAEYEKVKKISASRYRELDKFTLKAKAALKIELQKARVQAQISGRAKHIYSLWRKLQRPQTAGDLSKIYDLMALRVIVGTIEEAYQVLGIVHKLWRPLPDRFFDFIATPKANGYRSLHTTVFGPKGNLFEVQIRTEKMHNEAEFGICAHWHYSEKKAREGEEKINVGFTVGEKLNWVKQLNSWQQEISGSEEFLKSLKIDIFSDRIFALTPKGDVVDLPVGATPVDFAYSLHSEIGDRCTGARVDGKMKPLDYRLKNGEIIEIITSKNPKKPNRDWLSFTVTSSARARIRHQLRE